MKPYPILLGCLCAVLQTIPVTSLADPVGSVSPPFPTTTGYTTRAKGNLLSKLNTSFEAGLRNASTAGRAADTAVHCVDGGTQGKHCLRLDPGQGFVSEMVAVSPGKYTFSFDARSVGETTPLVASVLTSYQKAGLQRPKYGLLRVNRLAGEWTRISVPVEIPADCPGYVALLISHGKTPPKVDGVPEEPPPAAAVGSSTVELDALCLRSGDEAGYAAPAPVELGLTSPAAHASVFEDESIPVVVDLAALEPVRALQLKLQLHDVLYGDTREITLPQSPSELAANAVQHWPLTLPNLPAGQYLAVLTAQVGEEKVTANLVLSVKARHPAFHARAEGPFLGRIEPDEEGLGIARDIGVVSTRMHGTEYGTWWNQVEPQQGKFEFAAADAKVGFLRAAGIELLGLLNYPAKTGPPSWVETYLPPKGAFPTIKPLAKDIGLWRAYVKATVGHLRGKVRAWEIHNEPNGVMSVDAYLPQLQAAYEEAKAADPQCLIAGLCSTLDKSDRIAGDMLPFVEGALQKGAARWMDAISFHPYVWPLPPEQGGLERSVQQLDSMRDKYAKGKPLWCTEYGWTSHVVRPDRPATEAGPNNNLDSAGYSCLDAAAFCTRSILIQLAGGVEQIQFFNSPLPHAVLPYRAAAISLFDYDGTPLPVYLSYREAVQRLTAARFVSQHKPTPDTWAQVYQLPDEHRALLAVWRAGDHPQRPFPQLEIMPDGGTHVRVIDLFGRMLQDGGKTVHLPVSPMPVFVEVEGGEFPPSLLQEVLRKLGGK